MFAGAFTGLILHTVFSKQWHYSRLESFVPHRRRIGKNSGLSFVMTDPVHTSRLQLASPPGKGDRASLLTKDETTVAGPRLKLFCAYEEIVMIRICLVVLVSPEFSSPERLNCRSLYDELDCLQAPKPPDQAFFGFFLG